MPLISKKNIDKYSKHIQNYVILYDWGSEAHTAIERDFNKSGISGKNIDITTGYIDGYLLSRDELHLFGKSITSLYDKYVIIKLDRKYNSWVPSQFERMCESLDIQSRIAFQQEFGTSVQYKDIKQYLTI